MGRRRRVHPMVGLVVVAVVPAMVLYGAWRLADSRVPGPPPPGTAAAVTPSTAATPIFSVRRVPGMLARDVNRAALQADLQPLADAIGDTDCLAASIDGELEVAANEAAALHPASTVKVLVAAVALDVLGPDFRFTTEVRGAVDKSGTVAGDLYLVGGGDPVLNSEWWTGPGAYAPFNSTSVEELADAVVAAGVRNVAGTVVGDAGRYDDEWYPPTWPEEVRVAEGGPVSALLANDGRRSPTESSADPAAGAAQVLVDELVERGVTVGGPPVAGSTAADAPLVAELDSAPLEDLVAEMLTTSDNTTAELMLKELGRAASATGSRPAGLAVVEDTLAERGVPVDGLALLDGSGLSAGSTVTCTTMLAVLQQHPELAAAMAVAGDPRGTLAGTFSAAPLGGRLVAKTGTLEDAGIKALSGFLPLDGGGNIEFVLILNGAGVADQAEYLPLWEQLGAALADYLAAPRPAELGPR